MRTSSLRVAALCTAASGILWGSTASAHFYLSTPASWMSEDTLGTPQKAAPCGNETVNPPATATGKITTYQAGSTLTITLSETVPHDGHYRVALAQKADRSDLPAEPIVTAGATACGSVPIMNPPVFPVLADGALLHTAAAPLVGPQTITVQLPAAVTCTNCTLQVIEFMGNHGLNNPGGCFYHHCANIAIQTAPVPVTDMADVGDLSIQFITEDQGSTSTDPNLDLSASSLDGGTKPPAASAGVPGCDMGGDVGSASLISLALLLGALVAGRLRWSRTI